METNSRPEKEVSTSKQGQYRPRRKDTTPKVNPQLAVELVYAHLVILQFFLCLLDMGECVTFPNLACQMCIRDRLHTP